MNDDLDTDHGRLSAHEALSARQRLATEQAALFPTRVALARWRGGALQHLHGGHPPLRAAWFARLERNHQAWLDRGGFAQHDEGAAPGGAAPGGAAPGGTAPDGAVPKHAAMRQTPLPQASARRDRQPCPADGEPPGCGTCADRGDAARD